MGSIRAKLAGAQREQQREGSLRCGNTYAVTGWSRRKGLYIPSHRPHLTGIPLYHPRRQVFPHIIPRQHLQCHPPSPHPPTLLPFRTAQRAQAQTAHTAQTAITRPRLVRPSTSSTSMLHTTTILYPLYSPRLMGCMSGIQRYETRCHPTLGSEC